MNTKLKGRNTVDKNRTLLYALHKKLSSKVMMSVDGKYKDGEKSKTQT